MHNEVLFISPHKQDASTLSTMLGPVEVSLDHATTVQQARRKMTGDFYPVILTEKHLPDGSWTDVLTLAREIAAPSIVMVTDRIADDVFWAEILNLGAYDLLAQPFDCGEVQRILSTACMQARPKGAASETKSRRSANDAPGAAPRTMSHGSF